TNVDACETQRELAYRLNAEVPARLAKIAGKLNARMIQVSTDYIFDGEAGPYPEDAHPTPIGYYGKSKLAGDNEVLAASPNNVVARTSVLFGYEPNAAPDFVSWLLLKLWSNEPVNIVTDQYSTPTLTNSLATGLRQIIDANQSGVFHLVGAEYLNRYEFAVRIAELAGLPSGFITPVDGSTFTQTAPRPKQGGLTTKRTELAIGFQPLSIAEAMHVYLRQEQEQK
ncbi:MAG: SDR family oxidoreductase, partial [bacterium]|nr:SDR family oxidoreductase [bacterium]